MALFPLDGPSVQNQITFTTTPAEVKVGASTYSERKVVTIQPVDGTLRLTFQSGQPGFYLYQGGFYSFEASDSQLIYAYTDSGSVNAIVAERA